MQGGDAASLSPKQVRCWEVVKAGFGEGKSTY